MRLASIFSDHMVLQRGVPVPVWGQARPGGKISVRLEGADGVTAKTVAGKDGAWLLRLPPTPAGGPFELHVAAAGETTVICRDVMVGEVWVCSGQSNMEMTLVQTANAENEIAAARHPNLRVIKMPRVAQVTPLSDFSAPWQVCTPETAPGFSAAGYYFALELQRRLGVPVGLINSSWGGTIAEAWTSRQGLQTEPQFRPLIDKLDLILATPPAERAEVAAKEDKYPIPTDPGNQAFAKGWAAPATDCGDWQTMKLPSGWQFAGYDYSGVFWFRRELDIPAAWAGRDLDLHIGACDKDDVTYFNNEKVGSLGMAERADAWCTPRAYVVPGRLVRAGRNVVAVRVFSNVYQGGMIGPADSMWAAPAGAPPSDRLPLDGDWRFRVEHNFGKVTPPPPSAQEWGNGNQHTPSALFNGMIAPLPPFAIAGAIWYQGESNAGRATEYRTLFPAMIRDWRRVWGRGDFPFYFVQLANYMARKPIPAESNWAELREAQRLTLETVPNTGMAVIIDIGEAKDIHPRNKKDVGGRLARLALHHTYGHHEVVESGPVPAAAWAAGNKAMLRLHSVAAGIGKTGMELPGFALAGADRRFHWAKAIIEGADLLTISSPEVPEPLWLRHAWADNPDCGLRNSEDLPGTPFELPLPWGAWLEGRQP